MLEAQRFANDRDEGRLRRRRCITGSAKNNCPEGDMRTATAFTFTGMMLCIATNCFATEPASRPQIKNYEALGNVESKHEPGCIGTANLSNKFTPVDLYRAVVVCAKQGKNKDGALLFGLAGAYGRFDTLRVSDNSAHQAVSVLKMILSGMAPDQQNAFQEAVSKTFGSPDGLAAACKEIKRIGPPNYYPEYMIQHGLDAFIKSGSDDGLVKDFNAQAAWKESLDSYLHCPN